MSKTGKLAAHKNTSPKDIVRLDRAWNRYLHADWMKGLDNTTFMVRCREGRITRAELDTYVRQQYHYSRHFTRYLAALLANVGDEKDRRDLVENLFEEMGLGEFGSKPHSQIYRDMMAAMKVNPKDEPVFLATQKLIDTMLSLCADKNHLIGLGALCLAAEAIVPHMYSTIVHGFKAVGEAEKNLEFYAIHIEGDDEHAKTMRRIIDSELLKNPDAIHEIHHGARLGIKARIQFFEEISAHHKKTKAAPAKRAVGKLRVAS